MKRKGLRREAFLIIDIMHWFKIHIFCFAKAVIDILLDAAAAVFLDDMGIFSGGLVV